MHRRYRALLASTALICAAVPAGAQGLGMGMGTQDVVVRPGGGGILGPGDIVPFSVWWGLRAYSSAQKTGLVNGIRLRRASDNVELDIKITTAGDVDVGTAGTHCNLTTCFAALFYDQAGTRCAGTLPCSIGHAVLANQPEFVFNCFPNGKPCLRSGGTALIASTPTFTPATGVVSLYLTGGMMSGSSACAILFQNGTAGNRINSSIPNGYNMLGGTSGNIINSTTIGFGVRPVVGIMNGASSSLNVNGNVTTGTVTGNTVAGTTGGYRSPTGGICTNTESGFVDNVILNTTQQNALINSSRSYYGLP